MSLNSLPLNNSALYLVPKLAADGLNWLMYKEHTLTVMGTRGLMQHLNGTARHPPAPLAWPRPSPFIPVPIHTAIPTAPPASILASSAGQAAAASTSTTPSATPSTTAGTQTQGAGTTTPTSASTATTATAVQQQPVSGIGTSTATTMPLSDPYANLSDDDYFKKVKDAKAKVDEFKQREFATRQQIYSTISDQMLIRVKNLPTAAMVWTALVNEYKGKSEMYSNIIRTRLLNTRCPEGGNLWEHLDTLWHLREQLSSMGVTLANQEFSAAIFQSVPESYGYLLTSLSTAARISRNLITPIDIIQALNEEYDCRTAQAPSSDSALAAYQPGRQRKDIECFNCGRIGHVKSNCWRKGGGKEGQGPRDQMPRRNNHGGGGASANTTTKLSEHAFAITVDSAALTSTTSGGTKVEIFDSGATRHISPYRDEFITYEALEPARPISAADGHTFMAVGKGQVRTRLPNGDSSTVVMLEQVLHAPGIAFSLISIPQADRAGYSAVFENGECRLYQRSSRETVGRIPLLNGLYQVHRPEVAAAAVVGRGAETELSVLEFHCSMGHISPAVAKRMVEEGRVLSVKLTGGSTDETCDTCIQVKITRVPIPKECSSQLTKHYGDQFHADTWAANCMSFGGNKYAVMFTDDSTRWTHTVPEKEKNQAFPAYKALQAEVETQEGRKIKVLHTDRGGEFCSSEFEVFIVEHGGHHEKTPHDTPEGNGVSERANRTLAEHTRAMLIDSGLPQYLWSYALVHVTWLKNCTSTRALGGKTPYEACYGVQPNLRGLKPFGAKCWVRLEHAPKMQPKAVEGRFLGYAENEHGYYIYWPGRNKVSVERNVRFTIEPEPQVAAEDVQPEGMRKDVSQPVSPAPETSPTTPPPAASEPAEPTETPQNIENAPYANVPPAIPHATASPTSPPPSPPCPNATVEDVPKEEPEDPAPLGHGHQVKKPSATLRRLAAGEGTVDGRRGGASKLPRGLQPENLMGAAAIAELEDNWLEPKMPELESVNRDPLESQPNEEDELVIALSCTKKDWYMDRASTKAYVQKPTKKEKPKI